jgi:hypothetical protein
MFCKIIFLPERPESATAEPCFFTLARQKPALLKKYIFLDVGDNRFTKVFSHSSLIKGLWK